MHKASILMVGLSCLALTSCSSSPNAVDARIDMALDRAAERSKAIKDPEQQALMYERVYKQNPKSAKAASEYARVLRKQGQVQKAEAVLRIFADDVESPHFVYSEFAAVKLAKGEHGEAEIYARDALKKQDNDSYAAHTLGIALDGQGRYKEAEESFRTALDNWEGNPVPVMNNLALNLATQGYIDEAVSILERAKTLAPERQELERNLRIIRALNETNAEYFPEHNVPTPTKKPSKG